MTTQPTLTLCCCRYGQKNVVNEYVGSLVNTLTLYKDTDLRLEVFARWVSDHKAGNPQQSCTAELMVAMKMM
jgi:hypothetical protein